MTLPQKSFLIKSSVRLERGEGSSPRLMTEKPPVNYKLCYYFQRGSICFESFTVYLSKSLVEMPVLYDKESIQLEQGMYCGCVLSSHLGGKLCLNVVHAFPCLDNRTFEGKI